MARKGMKAMALALAAGGLSASGAASEPALLTEPVQGASLSSEIAPQILDLEYERFRRLTVPVTIDGQGPFRFMVDTGAQATVLSRALADRLGLVDRRTALLVGIASSAPVETVHLKELSLGRRTQAVPQVPLVEGEHIGDADGILGIDMLQDQRVLLDFGDRRITLADLEPQKTDRFEIIVRAHERLGQLIVSRALVDGIRTTVLIDTGAQGSIGNPALGRRLRRLPSQGKASMTDVHGQVLTGEAKIAGQLQLGNALLRNLPIAFADSPTFHMLGLSDRPALILGMSELRLFRRVAIDFRARRIMLDLPRETALTDSWPSPRLRAER